ncbi:MAG TPA: hypothetical protein VGU68_21680, partial [Ktedonobacteraceae bacterium]|nr:hypothetical protein [Ktedonobacteraceae bacterium]
LLFGTLLLGAFLLAGNLSSQVFAAPAVVSATSGGPSFARSFPNWRYNEGFRNGFAVGYRAGYRACANHQYEGSQLPDRTLHLTAYTRGYAAGYATGYNRGLHSCHDYVYGRHDYDNHGDSQYGNHDSQAPDSLHAIRH